MARTVFSRLAGAFLLIYGLAAILLGWWAYGVTHEAFNSVRSFTSIFQQERNRAGDALKGATDLLGGSTSGSTPGAAASSPAAPGSTAPGTPGGGPAILRNQSGLRDQLRGFLGGDGQRQASGQAGSAGASPATPPQANEGLGMLDQLERRLEQLGGGWRVLGEGPLRPGLLDQVELAVNSVLAWMGIHGLASVVIGFVLLIWQPSQARTPVPTPATWPNPPGPQYAQPGYPPSQYPQPQPPAPRQPVDPYARTHIIPPQPPNPEPPGQPPLR